MDLFIHLRAGLLVFLCMVFSCVFVSFSYGVPGQVWYLIVSIPDLCLLFNFVIQHFMFTFAIILMGKRAVVALLHLSFWCLVSVALPHGAIGWSAVYDCGISQLYSPF